MTEDLRALALDAIAGSSASADPDYPLVHLAPPVGRLNDPNGLLIDPSLDRPFRACYQFSPFHPHRKLVYWGSASSGDGLHWHDDGPVLIPDSPYDRSGDYSGSALVLGAQEAATAPGGTPYLLFFTGNLKDPVTDERTSTQCLATGTGSATGLGEVEKWPSNPLIAGQPQGYTPHFRDPHVTRDPERPGSYRMLVGVQRADLTGTALVYRSSDLLRWEAAGELALPDATAPEGGFGYMWECPGLVRLEDEQTGEERDVLIVCPQGYDPGAEGFENVFPCVYAVGDLVGTELRGFDGVFREVDRGFEFYAPQAFARRPSEPGPVLLAAWAGNAGEDDQPSISATAGEDVGWVHCLTIPRALSLRGGRLVQRPVLPEPVEPIGSRSDGVPFHGPAGAAWDLVLDGRHEGASVRIGGEDCCAVVSLVRREDGRAALVVDRSASRYSQHGSAREVPLGTGPLPRMRIIHDRSITEVFLGDGETAFTMRSFVSGQDEGPVITLAAGSDTGVRGSILI